MSREDLVSQRARLQPITDELYRQLLEARLSEEDALFALTMAIAKVKVNGLSESNLAGAAVSAPPVRRLQPDEIDDEGGIHGLA